MRAAIEHIVILLLGEYQVVESSSVQKKCFKEDLGGRITVCGDFEEVAILLKEDEKCSS